MTKVVMPLFQCNWASIEHMDECFLPSTQLKTATELLSLLPFGEIGIMRDLPGAQYQYPPHTGMTDLQPDIVIWHDSPKEVTLVEVTVCFETPSRCSTDEN